MSQASIVLPETNLALKKDVDAALAAISTLNAGATDPGTGPGAYAFWADTGNSVLKQRNADNSAWVTICALETALASASGNANQSFSVADATEANQAVSLEQLKAAIAAIKGGVPAGAIISSASSTAPDGYLLCDGSAVSRTTYDTLFAAIGSTYGAGDGSTTFNIPDGRGVVLRGLDSGRGLDANRVLGSYQADAMQNITATWGAKQIENTVSGAAYVAGTWLQNATGGSGAGTLYGFDASRQVRTATENRMKNLAVNFFIKS